jgi:hypothetical protein
MIPRAWRTSERDSLESQRYSNESWTHLKLFDSVVDVLCSLNGLKIAYLSYARVSSISLISSRCFWLPLE